MSQSCKELVENSIDDEISCGQKIGKCVILRGFHDRMHSEPRGKSNLYRVERTTNDSCRSHKEWLQTITNDPKIVVSFWSRLEIRIYLFEVYFSYLFIVLTNFSSL